MTGVLGSLLAFIVAISVLVAVHEYGHFWVARRLGVKVLRFSIGFGKPLWRTTFGVDRTEFVIASLPFGGYVKMLDEREGPVAAADEARAFNRQSLRVRMAVVSAGPLFNFIFAIAAYWLMFFSGIPGLKPIVGEIEASSYAAQAGFQEQDQIISINGHKIATWDDATIDLLDAALARNTIEIGLLAADETRRDVLLDFTEMQGVLDKGGLLKNIGFSAFRPKIPAVIDRVISDGAAEQAGLQSGDQIISANDVVINDWSGWVNIIRANPEKEIPVLVQRGADQLKITITPKSVKNEGETIGQIGAYVRQPKELIEKMRTEVRYGPIESLSRAVYKTWEMSALTVRTLWGMITGHASIENISGPISIAQYAGYSAQIGFASFLKFLAVVSISLGVLNLLPIPVLDGGHLLYYGIEGITGRPLSEAVQQIAQQVGVGLLLVLMSVAFYNDLSRLFGA